MTQLNNRHDIFSEIHKRTVLFDHEVQKELLADSPHLQYGDRFIPRRRNRGIPTTTNQQTASNDAGLLAELLRDALDIRIAPQLKLTDPPIARPFFSDRSAERGNFLFQPPQWVPAQHGRFRDLDWLCRPRRRPTIDAHSSHEFRGFTGTAVGTHIEWAWTGHFVSYCEGALLLWHPREDLVTKYELRDVVTLAFHPHNRALATAHHRHARVSVHVWTFEGGAMRSLFSHRLRQPHPVTALCWHKHGVHLLAGDVRGVLRTIDVRGNRGAFHRTPATHEAIKEIKFSSSGQFVASLDMVGRLYVWAYNGGHLQLHHLWDCGTPSNASMDWHPWTDADLVLCIERRRLLLVLNILSRRTEAFSTGGAIRMKRPVVSFNRLSAELVLGCQRTGDGGQVHPNVLVMGAVDRVVDELEDVGAVETAFLWSPDHEQLAFVAGNDIQIYNFFGGGRGGATERAAYSNSANLTGDKPSIFKQFDFIK